MPDRQIHASTRVSRILMSGDTEPWELWIGLFTAFWGVWFAMPFTHSSAPVFHTLPRWYIGVPVALVGALKLIALLRGDYGIRLIAGVIMTMTWSGIAVAYVYASWDAQSTGVYPAFAIAAGWTVLRINRSRLRA